MCQLMQCFEDRGLMDMGCSRHKFTWNNRQQGVNNVSEGRYLSRGTMIFKR